MGQGQDQNSKRGEKISPLPIFPLTQLLSFEAVDHPPHLIRHLPRTQMDEWTIEGLSFLPEQSST